MESSRSMVAVIFALILVMIYWVACVYVLNPILRAESSYVEQKMSFYIDTMSSVSSGSVKVEIPKNTVSAISVEKLAKGDYDDYTIPEDGWYVVVAYRIAGTLNKGVSRINSYPDDDNIRKTFTSPEDFCIIKNADMDYAVVGKC
ncbi:MAG: hypothetical protein JW789_03835 [Candidatus Aenigmarchaeota archaeon]|nr:hypothetical protein [Candidatus Aenigmarchaeota archaeon]